MFERLTSAKNYVVKHKTAILVTSLVVTTTAAVLMRGGLKQHDEFLKNYDLYDVFYSPEDY